MLTSNRLRSGLCAAFFTFVLLVVGFSGSVRADDAIPESVTNPPAQKQCGFDLVLLLDASTSIRDYGIEDTNGAVDDVIAASTALLQAFIGTNSRVAIVSYSNLARRQIGFTHVSATTTGAGGVHQRALGTAWTRTPISPILTDNGYAEHVRAPDGSGATPTPNGFGTQTGYTNWQAGFDETLNVLRSARAGVPTMVMHLTDGRPTAYSTSTGFSRFGKAPLSNGITSANSVKAFDSGSGGGTHLYSIGIKAANNPDSLLDTSLSLVSGPNTFSELDGDGISDFDAVNDDVIVLKDFENLRAIFSRFAASFCAPSVTLTKVVNSAGYPDNFVPSAGWKFESEVTTTAHEVYDWVLPDDGNISATSIGTTASNGRVQFQWDVRDEANWNRSIRFTEKVNEDYDLAEVVCTRTRVGDDDPDSASTFRPAVSGQTFDMDVGVADIVSCEVKNTIDQAPALTLQTTATPKTYSDVGDEIGYEYRVTSTGINPVYLPITIEDDRVPDNSSITCSVEPDTVRLETNESVLCTATYVITERDLAQDEIRNTARASGFDEDGRVVRSESDTASATIHEIPKIELTAEAFPKVYDSVGQIIEYTYTVTNTGHRPLSAVDQVSITDNRPGSLSTISCESSLGLRPGDSIKCFARYEIADADMVSMSVVHSATASVSGIHTPKTLTSVDLVAVQLIKTVNPVSFDSQNQVLTYSFEVTNVGKAAITGPIRIFDDRLGLDGLICREAASAGNPALEPGQSARCHYPYTTVYRDLVAGGIVNVAEATADGAESEDRVEALYTGVPIDPETCETGGKKPDSASGKKTPDLSKKSSDKESAKPATECVEGEDDTALRAVDVSSSQTDVTPTRTPGFYKQHPRGLFRCLAAASGDLDVGIMRLRDELYDDEIDARRVVGVVGDADDTAETAYEMLYGVMTANVSMLADKSRRSRMDGQCLRAAKQLVAARCNGLLFGAQPRFSLDRASSAVGRLCTLDSSSTLSRGGRLKQISKWSRRLKRFNKSGRRQALPADGSLYGRTAITPDDPTDPTD